MKLDIKAELRRHQKYLEMILQNFKLKKLGKYALVRLAAHYPEIYRKLSKVKSLAYRAGDVPQVKNFLKSFGQFKSTAIILTKTANISFETDPLVEQARRELERNPDPHIRF